MLLPSLSASSPSSTSTSTFSPRQYQYKLHQNYNNLRSKQPWITPSIIVFGSGILVLTSLILSIQLSSNIIMSTTSSSTVSSSSSSSSFFPPLSSSSSSSSSSLANDCEKRLDALDAIFNEKRKMRQLYLQDIMDETVDDVDLYYGIQTAMDIYEPEANCFTEERFGFTIYGSSQRPTGRIQKFSRFHSFGDGPKFLCGVDYIAKKKSSSTSSSSSSCLVYSIGSNNQIEFEQSVKQLMPNCETHTFDPTLKKPFIGNEYAIFHPWGFGVDGDKKKMSNDTYFETSSFQTIYHDRLQHTGRDIDIFKIDCEGCEFTILPELFQQIADGILKVHQVQVEIHTYFFQTVHETLEPMKRIFESADRAKMRVFHKERNQWGCAGYKCLEYAFVSEEFLRAVNKEVICGEI